MKRLITLALASFTAFALMGCAGNSTEKLYDAAVEDAKQAEAEEIMPLVSLTPEDSMVTWNEDGTKVLLLCWNEYPESYVADSDFTCEYGDIWTFTDKEIIAWYEQNHEGVKDWNLRLEQLIGLPTDKEYTHVSAFWVDPENVIRPSYQPDITGQMSEELLDGSALSNHEPWFQDNTEYSYSEETPYPWTRLGYTYDWADNGTDYGLTEFLIMADSVIEVEWTMTTEEFIEWLDEGQ